MHVMFDHKKAVIKTLANRDKWSFRDEVEWLLDPERRKKIIYSPDGENESPSDDNGPLHSGRFFHEAFFDRNSLHEAGDRLTDRVKLFVAHDLGIEDSLDAKGVNPNPAIKLRHDLGEVDLEQPGAVEEWSSQSGRRVAANIHTDFTQIDETADFDVAIVQIPRNFAFQIDDDHYGLATTLDNRDILILRSSVLSNAFEQQVRPSSVPSDHFDAGAFINSLLACVEPLRVDNDSWLFGELETDDGARLAAMSRFYMREYLNMPEPSYAAVSTSKNTVAVATSVASFTQAVQARLETIELLKQLKNSKDDPDKVANIIQQAAEQGANMKYLHPSLIEKGGTVIDHLEDAEEFEVLAAIKKAGALDRFKAFELR